MVDLKKIALVGALIICSTANVQSCKDLFASCGAQLKRSAKFVSGHPTMAVAAVVATAAGAYSLNEFVHKKFAAWKKKQQANFSKNPEDFAGKTIVIVSAEGKKIIVPDLSFRAFIQEKAAKNKGKTGALAAGGAAVAALVVAIILGKTKPAARPAAGPRARAAAAAGGNGTGPSSRSGSVVGNVQRGRSDMAQGSRRAASVGGVTQVGPATGFRRGVTAAPHIGAVGRSRALIAGNRAGLRRKASVTVVDAVDGAKVA